MTRLPQSLPWATSPGHGCRTTTTTPLPSSCSFLLLRWQRSRGVGGGGAQRFPLGREVAAAGGAADPNDVFHRANGTSRDFLPHRSRFPAPLFAPSSSSRSRFPAFFRSKLFLPIAISCLFSLQALPLLFFFVLIIGHGKGE